VRTCILSPPSVAFPIPCTVYVTRTLLQHSEHQIGCVIPHHIIRGNTFSPSFQCDAGPVAPARSCGASRCPSRPT
jgi:hypothetical protein